MADEPTPPAGDDPAEDPASGDDDADRDGEEGPAGRDEGVAGDDPSPDEPEAVEERGAAAEPGPSEAGDGTGESDPSEERDATEAPDAAEDAAGQEGAGEADTGAPEGEDTGADEAGGSADQPAVGPVLEGDREEGRSAAAGDTAAGEGPDADAAADAEAEAAADAADGDDTADGTGEEDAADAPEDEEAVPPDVRKYERFTKVDGAQYDRVNDFLRERTYITAREWAIARLCADFRTETGVEMTKIGENLEELVPFMEDSYSPQAVNQARSSFEEKVQKAGATFLYGAMCDFFTAEELDELMYEVTEVAKFLLEVEGVDLTVEEELAAEDRISGVMREVREASEALRYDECPHCGEQLRE